MTGQVRRTGLASSRSGEELVVKVKNAGDLMLENLLFSHLPWPGL